jgi:hypothetical protein
VRREIESAGAHLDNVAHSDHVQFEFSLPDSAAAQLVRRLNEVTAAFNGSPPTTHKGGERPYPPLTLP